jgi:hypothetical protein
MDPMHFSLSCHNPEDLQERIHFPSWKLFEISGVLLETHLRLAVEFSAADWALIYRITSEESSELASTSFS